MALTVGELLATITVDDAPARAGMQRAETAMQATGDRMVAEAEQAGAEAGDAIAEGVADGAEQGAQQGAGALEQYGWAAVGATVGAALMVGISTALEQGQVEADLAAQLGRTGPEAAAAGDAAGKLYASAIVDSVQEGADVIRGIARNGLLPTEATEAQMTALGKGVATTARVLGEDVSKVTRAVGTMLKNGIAKNAEEAMDILVKGAQNGVDVAEDLLDTFSEYPTEFRQLGLDAQTAMGLLQQGLQGGARDADAVADGLKEFTLLAQGMGEDTAASFKALGFNGSEMQKVFQEGGPKAGAALDQILDRLRAVKDPAKQSEIALGLFSTKAEDMQQAIKHLDPSAATAALGEFKGATKAAGDTMHDTAAHRFEAFKRGLTQGVVEAIGTHAIPALITGAEYAMAFGRGIAAAAGFVSDNSAVFGSMAAVITVVMLPALVGLGVTATTTTAAVVAGWAAQSAAAVRAGAASVASNATILAGWVAQGAAAAATAGRVVGAWILMGTQSMIHAGRMAAAWIIAMGPIALVIAAVVGIVALIVSNWDTIVSATETAWNWVWEKIQSVGQFLLDLFLNFTLVGIIIKHWDSIKSGTVRVWNSITEWVRGIPGAIAGYFLNWTIAGLIIRHWQSAKDGAIRKGAELLTWARGLPGQINAGIGSLGTLLYDKGEDLVRGLWNGIKSMGSWLADKLSGWAKSAIPGPISKALGIASPSKLMARAVGRWIPAGVVQGIESGSAAVARTMRDLVAPPAVPTLTPAVAGVTGAYGAPGTTAGGPSGATVHVEHWHAAENGTPDDNAKALAWLAKARG